MVTLSLTDFGSEPKNDNMFSYIIETKIHFIGIVLLMFGGFIFMMWKFPI